MHKVVIERPRWNPGPAKLRRAASLQDDLKPKYQGMRQPYSSRKAFTDLLGPLRRWLHSQVGRPWDDVYSEACQVITPNSVVRLHIKTHLLEFVERNTFIHEGEVCYLETWRGGGIRRVSDRLFGRAAFYVHPESGLLLVVTPEARRLWRKARRQKKPLKLKWLDPHAALKEINGIWYMCEFREVPAHKPFKAYDHVACKFVGRGGLTARDGVWLHCIGKRQLSWRELRRYGLRNDISAEGNALFSALTRIEAGAPFGGISW